MKPVPSQPDFDPVARIYRWAEYLALGSALQNMRTHFIPKVRDCHYAFVLGDGDGRFLAELLRKNPHVSATAVDTSRRMLALLAERCGSWHGRLRTIQASAADVVPKAGTDLIVSHFFLDCLSQEELENLTKKISEACQSGTRWLISDFQVPEGAVLRRLGAAYIRLLYAVFRVLTGLRVQRLPSIRTAMIAANFERVSHKQSLRGLLYTEVWSLTKSGHLITAQPEGTVKHPLEVGC